MSDSPDPETIRFGLSRAIQIHSEEYRAKNPNTKMDLDLVEDENLLPQDTCLMLYRVYLERLQQIAGKARAKQIWIHYYPSRTHMVLDIKDDGAGMQIDTAGMSQSLAEAGGELSVTNRPEGGTALTVRVPFPR
jgi:glucose-6-phosphate-specific signal transduction histidine kinase